MNKTKEKLQLMKQFNLNKSQAEIFMRKDITLDGIIKECWKEAQKELIRELREYFQTDCALSPVILDYWIDEKLKKYI